MLTDQPRDTASNAFGLPGLWRPPTPKLGPVPKVVRGFRIRIDLMHTKPTVWRTFDVSGDTTLPHLHTLLQAIMGWQDCHLHAFRTSNEHPAPMFLTQFEVEEGEEGLAEEGVRLDQLVTQVGDRLWYDYDFGDGWEHVLRVQQVFDVAPERPRCISGRYACPPEDCGGVWGHHQIAEWVRNNYDEGSIPQQFISAAEARDWLPPGWHPDTFHLDDINEMVEWISTDLPPLTNTLSIKLEELGAQASALHEVLKHAALLTPADISALDADSLMHPFMTLIEAIGTRTELTSAGYLPPKLVQHIADQTGLTSWWIGTTNREVQTRPVAMLRSSAQRLGLVSVRKGVIAPTRVAQRFRGDAHALLRHVIERLPVGTGVAEHDAGWIALMVAGAEVPMTMWRSMIGGLMFGIGWRDSSDSHTVPHPDSWTLTVLDILAGVLSSPHERSNAQHDVGVVARAALFANA